MTDDARRGRRYSEEEVALIIQRAAELQQREPVEGDPAAGLSLGDVEAIAREAGLDPSLIRRAAGDLDTGHSPDTVSPFLGAASTLRLERTVSGELPESEYVPLVEEIRRALGETGQVSTLGRSLAWSTLPPSFGRNRSRQVSVSIVPRHGQTTIRVEESLKGAATGLFAGLMGGVGGGGSGVAIGVGLGAFHSGLAAAGLWGALLAGSYTLARVIYVSLARRRGHELRALLDRLASYAAETTEPAAGPRRLDDATRG